MIDVKLDLSRADRREVEAFLALPGVARAIDAMTHAPMIDDAVKIHIAIEPSRDQVLPDDHWNGSA